MTFLVKLDVPEKLLSHRQYQSHQLATLSNVLARSFQLTQFMTMTQYWRQLKSINLEEILLQEAIHFVGYELTLKRIDQLGACARKV